jgi:hypothetical protein
MRLRQDAFARASLRRSAREAGADKLFQPIPVGCFRRSFVVVNFPIIAAATSDHPLEMVILCINLFAVDETCAISFASNEVC